MVSPKASKLQRKLKDVIVKRRFFWVFFFKTCVIPAVAQRNTPLKINLQPKNHSLEKEHLRNLIFLVPCSIWCTVWLWNWIVQFQQVGFEMDQLNSLISSSGFLSDRIAMNFTTTFQLNDVFPNLSIEVLLLSCVRYHFNTHWTFLNLISWMARKIKSMSPMSLSVFLFQELPSRRQS